MLTFSKSIEYEHTVDTVLHNFILGGNEIGFSYSSNDSYMYLELIVAINWRTSLASGASSVREEINVRVHSTFSKL